MTGKARSYFEYIAQAVKYYRKYQQPLPENVSKAARKLQDYCKRISEHFETLQDAIGDVDTILEWSESLYDFGDATLKLVESPFNINDWVDALGAVNELCGLANNWATEIALKGSPVAARLSFLTAYVGAMLTIANQVIPWFKNVMEERHRAFERAAAGAEPKPQEVEPVYPGD